MIERPFIALFFLLASASIEIELLSAQDMQLAAHAALRAGGIVLGATLGAGLAGTAAPTRRWVGLELLPQAGVALGMALAAVERVPDRLQEIHPVVIAANAVFEIAGPVFTPTAIRRAASGSYFRVSSFSSVWSNFRP